MSSSLLVPTGCHFCSKTWLAPPPTELPPVCHSCNDRAEVVPGECYRPNDVALFERIERAVYAAELSEPSSYRLWVVLSNASERWRNPGDLLQPLVDTIPTLKFLVDELARDRAQLAHCIGMSLAVVTTRLHTFETQRHLSQLVAQTLREQRPE